MQPIRQLRETLATLADREHCLFSVADLAAAVPESRQLPLLLSRAVKAGILRRVCKGMLYAGVTRVLYRHLTNLSHTRIDRVNQEYARWVL